MAKTCINCGKKISAFANDPFESDNIDLCYECAQPISSDVNDLYYLKSKKDFDEARDAIIKKCTELYSSEIVNGVSKKIDLIYNNIKTTLVNDIPQEKSEQKESEPNIYKEHPDSIGVSHPEESSMYANIGKKIKGLTKCAFFVEALAAVLAGLFLLFCGANFIILGLLLLICGPIVAWISSWILYAFGELVDKITENEKNTSEILNIMRENAKK